MKVKVNLLLLLKHIIRYCQRNTEKNNESLLRKHYSVLQLLIEPVTEPSKVVENVKTSEIFCLLRTETILSAVQNITVMTKVKIAIVRSNIIETHLHKIFYQTFSKKTAVP